MRKVLLTTLFLSNLAFSYELNFNKSFLKNINADTLSTNINITVLKKDEKSVNLEIEKFNNFLKNTKNTKNITIQNTNYNLTPRYEYENSKSVSKGYIGNSSFSVKSENPKEINIFLNDLIALKESIKSNDLKLNIGNLSWELSDILQTKVTDELRLEALIWIEEYSQKLSTKISKKCEVKNVNINEEYSNNIPRMKMMSVAMDSAVNSVSSDIAPINSEQDIKINTNFILDCK